MSINIKFNFFFTILQTIDTASASSSLPDSSTKKVIIRSTSYGPLDNYIVRSLSKEDKKRFYTLLIRLTVSYKWILHQVNNLKAKELFEFLNPFLKLLDYKTFSKEILQNAIFEKDNAMKIVLKKDLIGVTLTFDGWTNIKNEYLLKVIIMISEGRPYI